MSKDRISMFMLWATVAIVAAALTLLACRKKEESVRCRWESRYLNTLQHDIHREWVCK
jgi:hypothetical protein